tara:strand:+ start:307 stop:540 length:234 start_codon:yes stop_codon:yes gene_type:complete
MSQSINPELPLTDPEHRARQQAHAAHLKLFVKNQLAAIRREKQIQIQAERERNYQDGSCIRYDALRSAAYAAKVGAL